jgi:hypothetical protein
MTGSGYGDANQLDLIGLWADDVLYLGAMEGRRVAFVAGGAGWFEHANALATETERFTWEEHTGGAVRIRFTHYLFRQNHQPAKVEQHWQDQPLVMNARVGPGTDALDRETTVLTLEDPDGQVHRYALVRRDIQDTDVS